MQVKTSLNSCAKKKLEKIKLIIEGFQDLSIFFVQMNLNLHKHNFYFMFLLQQNF